MWSAAGYLVPRAMLRDAGIEPTRSFASQAFLGSHIAVIEAVARGAFDVGATFCSVDANRRLLRRAWTDEHGLKALAISDPIPGDTICVAPSVPARDARSIAERFVDLATEASSRALVVQAFGADHFVPGEPTRYAALEAALAEDIADVE